jgi:hypothetical protein
MDRWLHLASPHSRPDSMRVNGKMDWGFLIAIEDGP